MNPPLPPGARLGEPVRSLGVVVRASPEAGEAIRRICDAAQALGIRLEVEPHALPAVHGDVQPYDRDSDCLLYTSDAADE